MAGAAPTYPPLDLDALRAAVAAGRQVRVGVLPTGQFPDGTAGRVRTIGAPEVDGPEFIQVELMVGGAKDVVPFAPADLSPVRRGQSAPEPVVRAATPRRAQRTGSGRSVTAASPTLSLVPSAPTSRSTPAAAATPPPRPRGRRATPPTTDPALIPAHDAALLPSPETAAPVIPGATGRSDAAGGASAAAASGGSGPSPAAGSRRSDRAKRQPISVTLATTGPDHTSWTVQVTVGSCTVVKPSPVPPAQAWTVVTGLGHPEVEKFVAGALSDHRRQTQERADRLARELAEAQAELAGYPDL